ncbi:hypothetical protein ACU8KI_01010 [Rhizobium leguminosarum]
MQQEISLYLDLKKGMKVDLATAARAALAFDAALKEIAFSIDPFATIRIELESGTEGSLSLNSIISAAKLDQARLKAIAWGIAAFFVADTASYTYEKVLDHLFAEPEIHQSLSQAEIEDLAAAVVRIVESKATEKQVGKIYQELQRDEAVKGVGVSPKHGRRPTEIVPRSEFQKRGRIVEESEKTGQRSETTVQTLTLVSPVLVQGSARKWKFRSGKLEFGAPVKDRRFLDRVLSGREPVPMSDGIRMKVVLTVKEERKDDVWQIKDRIIDEVIEITPATEQTSLNLGAASEQRED